MEWRLRNWVEAADIDLAIRSLLSGNRLERVTVMKRIKSSVWVKRSMLSASGVEDLEAGVSTHLTGAALAGSEVGSLRLGQENDQAGCFPLQLGQVGSVALHAEDLWCSPQLGQDNLEVHSVAEWPKEEHVEQYFGTGAGMWEGSAR